MATHMNDTEALLQNDEDHPPNRGTFRPLRTLVFAGSVLGVASVAVPRFLGRSSSTLIAPLTGLIEKDEVETFPLGVYIDAHTDVKECLEVGSEGKVEIKDCDEDSDKQKFIAKDFHIMWGEKCLKAPGVFVDCPDEQDNTTHFMLWRRGTFGTITNCACEDAQNCPMPCEDQEQLKVDGDKLALSLPGTDFTTSLKWQDMDTGPFPCAPNGDNCMKSKCCSEVGMTCFEKNEHWASCNATCSNKMKWVGGKWAEQDEDIWTCKTLSDPPECTKNGGDCSDSKCCSDPESTCFKKNDHWASCNKTCDHNMLWKDDKWQKQDEKVWDCGVLSCTANGQDCTASKCCSEPGMTCFKKNDHWSSCNKTCDQNMMWKDNGWEKQDEKVWSCEALSCTPNGQNCMDSKCCSEPGMTCFKKNEHWASCNKTCSKEMLWVDDGWQKQDKNHWDCAVLSCTPNGENCMESKCCSEPGMTCFKKNEHWASCNKTCSHDMLWVEDGWEKQDEKIWDCTELTED